MADDPHTAAVRLLEKMKGGDPDKYTLVRIAELTAICEALLRMEAALQRLAGLNNFAGVSDDLIYSAMANALQECELTAREALSPRTPQADGQ